MATMIPYKLSNIYKPTTGEKQLFDLFSKNLPEKCIVRYQVLIGERELSPDFVIIDPERGIILVEVKDWVTENIVSTTEESFIITGYNHSQNRVPQPNPDKKCQKYLGHLREQLFSNPKLNDADGYLQIPVHCFIVFTNLSYEQSIIHGIDRLMTKGKVIYRDDLSEATPIFIERINSLPLLDAPLDADILENIKYSLFTDITLPNSKQNGFIPSKVNSDQQQLHSASMHALSLEQEKIAKSLGEGPRLLRGIAGTGKTLIMLYRAKLMMANDPDKRILFLCWTRSLATYMKQAYKGFNFSAKDIEITHLGGYISRLNGGLDKYDDDNEITLVLGLHAIGESEKYDAVFIDEAQDFRKEWIEMIFNKFIKGERNERNFLVATDDAQRIFPGRDFTWKSLNIPMRGHSKILKTIYRNSARVWAYSALLQGDVASYINERKGQLHFSLKSGFDPQFQLCKDMNAQIDEAINLIQKMIAGGYSPRNVLVLYRSKIAPHSNFAIVDELRNRLSLNHIPHTWITQNGHSKSSFDWEEDSVKISSIHSAKGMDSPVVIILGAETFVKGYYKDDEEIDEKRLMYVAMTRAQEFLMILGSGRKGLVPDLLRVEKEYQRFRPGIISLENGSDNQEDISPEEEDRETD